MVRCVVLLCHHGKCQGDHPWLFKRVRPGAIPKTQNTQDNLPVPALPLPMSNIHLCVLAPLALPDRRKAVIRRGRMNDRDRDDFGRPDRSNSGTAITSKLFPHSPVQSPGLARDRLA